mmetsp:Transcript_27233/g.72260  ORF Transcript_27233/g.72260 Transcript_27233/m.72260 type:complete len:548 (-) Transcript_27233:1422-3065(-)
MADIGGGVPPPLELPLVRPRHLPPEVDPGPLAPRGPPSAGRFAGALCERGPLRGPQGTFEVLRHLELVVAKAADQLRDRHLAPLPSPKTHCDVRQVETDTLPISFRVRDDRVAAQQIHHVAHAASAALGRDPGLLHADRHHRGSLEATATGLALVGFPPAAERLQADAALGLELVHLGRRRGEVAEALLDRVLPPHVVRPSLLRHLLHPRQEALLDLLQQVDCVRLRVLAAEEDRQVAEGADRGDEDQAEPTPQVAEEAGRDADHLRLEHGGQEEGPVRVEAQRWKEYEDRREEHDDAPIHPSLGVDQKDSVGHRNTSAVSPAAHDQLIGHDLACWPTFDDNVHGEEGEARMHDASRDPADQRPGVEVVPLDAELVQTRHEQSHLRGDVDVKNAEHQYRQRCEGQVEGGQQVGLVQRGAAESVERGVERQWQHEEEVFVEGVADDDACPPQVPAPVHEEHLLQEAELSNGEVRCIGSLPPLDAEDAHTDVRLLDHADVVASVADGEGQRVAHDVGPHKLDEGGLLRGREAAGDDGARGAGDGEEELS